MAVSLNISSITRSVPADVSLFPSAARCRRPPPRQATNRRSTAGAMSPRTAAAAAAAVRRRTTRRRHFSEAGTTRRRWRQSHRVELTRWWLCRLRLRLTSPHPSRPRRRRITTCDDRSPRQWLRRADLPRIYSAVRVLPVDDNYLSSVFLPANNPAVDVSEMWRIVKVMNGNVSARCRKR